MRAGDFEDCPTDKVGLLCLQNLLSSFLLDNVGTFLWEMEIKEKQCFYSYLSIITDSRKKLIFPWNGISKYFY